MHKYSCKGILIVTTQDCDQTSSNNGNPVFYACKKNAACSK